MKNLIFALFITSGILALCGCSKDTVYMSNQYAVQVGFYSAYTGKDSTVTSLSAHGIGRSDSLIYDSATVKSIYLPLKLHEERTQFVLTTLLAGVSRQDTLTFVATKKPHYVNGEEGFAFDFQLSKVYCSSNFVDTVVISDPAVNYNETFQNVKVYIY